MTEKLGRYKFKHCRFGKTNHDGYAFMFECPFRPGHVLQSRRICDSCSKFEPKDNLLYLAGLPEERREQDRYRKKQLYRRYKWNISLKPKRRRHREWTERT
jgi:hypothetical protein